MSFIGRWQDSVRPWWLIARASGKMEEDTVFTSRKKLRRAANVTVKHLSPGRLPPFPARKPVLSE